MAVSLFLLNSFFFNEMHYSKKKKRCEIPTGVATKIKNPRLEVTVILHSSTPRVSNHFSKKKKRVSNQIPFLFMFTYGADGP